MTGWLCGPGAEDEGQDDLKVSQNPTEIYPGACALGSARIMVMKPAHGLS